MSTIQELMSVDTLNGSDQFPIYNTGNASARKVSAATARAFFQGGEVAQAFASKLAAVQAIADIGEDQLVTVLNDETPGQTYTNHTTVYQNQGGTLVFLRDLEQVRTDLLNPASGFGADLVKFSQSQTGTLNSVTARLKGMVFVTDAPFNAKGDGVTDDAPAIQAALNFAMTNNKAIYIPAGRYLCNSAILTGNTAATVSKFVGIYGSGRNTVLLARFSSTDGVITVRGVNPEVDGSGNRHDGRVQIESLRIEGNSFQVGTGIRLDGLQGAMLRNVYIEGLAAGIRFHNTDLIGMYACWVRLCVNGMIHTCSGYAADGQFNSFIVRDSYFLNNTQIAIDYKGGIAPVFEGNNFVANDVSMRLGFDVAVNVVTVNPVIRGNYFENDLSNSLVFGGVAGIVRGADVSRNSFLVLPTKTAILCANVEHNTGADFSITQNQNSVSGGIGVYTFLNDSGSLTKPYFNEFNGYPIGQKLAAEATFTKVNSKLKAVALAAAATSNILTIGGASAPATLLVSVRGFAAGVATQSVYQISVMGGGVAATFTPISTVNFSGGGVTFSLATFLDTPVAGTNTLRLTNTSVGAVNFEIDVLVLYSGATITYL